DVLNDIVASFHPDPQHEEIDSPSGRRPLQAAMLAEVAKLVPQLTRLRSSSESSEEAKLAADLLRRLDG
ncbi:MAG: hypothetical protein JNK15_26055, partial [Planctomycetes bacterium]|nr:hypothetical protein [Planctomycetota bacterium]